MSTSLPEIDEEAELREEEKRRWIVSRLQQESVMFAGKLIAKQARALYFSPTNTDPFAVITAGMVLSTMMLNTSRVAQAVFPERSSTGRKKPNKIKVTIEVVGQQQKVAGGQPADQPRPAAAPRPAPLGTPALPRGEDVEPDVSQPEVIVQDEAPEPEPADQPPEALVVEPQPSEEDLPAIEPEVLPPLPRQPPSSGDSVLDEIDDMFGEEEED